VEFAACALLCSGIQPASMNIEVLSAKGGRGVRRFPPQVVLYLTATLVPPVQRIHHGEQLG
jgi:hypothetical protein